MVMKGKFLSTVSLVLASSLSSDAFRPLGTVKTTQPRLYSARFPIDLDSSSNDEQASGRRDFIANLASGISVASIWGMGSAPPVASAEEIKTLDMSMPTYDSINTLKSSAESEKALGVENPPETPSKGPAAPRKKKSSGGGGGGGGNPLGNVLPSMNKSVGKKPRSTGTATAASERPPRRVREEKADDDDEIKTMDMSLPSYAEGVRGKEKSAFAL